MFRQAFSLKKYIRFAMSFFIGLTLAHAIANVHIGIIHFGVKKRWVKCRLEFSHDLMRLNVMHNTISSITNVILLN